MFWLSKFSAETAECFNINRCVKVVNLFNISNNFGVRAQTSDSIIGSVPALLMNCDMMISVLYTG